MKHKDPGWLRWVLLAVAALSIYGLAKQFGADGAAYSHKWALRWACLLGGVGPALVLSLLRRRSAPVLRVCFAAALMTYLIARGAVDLGAMAAAGSRWQWLVAGAALILTMPVMGAERWRMLLSVQGVAISHMQSLRLMLVSFFFNICLPGATGGDLFRAYAIGKRTAKTAEAVTTIVLDRLSGLAALCAILACAILVNTKFILETRGIREAAVVLVGILLSLLSVLAVLMSRRIADRLRRTALARWQFPGRHGMVRAYKALHAYHGSYRILALACLISAASHIATITAAWCFAQAVGLSELAFARYFLIVPLGLAVNAIPLAPGGLGQGQKAFEHLFAWSLPQMPGAGGLGGAVMTFIHMALFGVAVIGGIVYAAGYHDLHAAVEQAEEEDEREESEELAELGQATAESASAT